VDLPADVEEALGAIAVPGEAVEFAAPAGSRWVVLTPLALYVGLESLERYPRGWVTGIEFDRQADRRGAMVFVGRDGVLDTIEFDDGERAALQELESRLSSGQAAPPAPVVASAPPKRAKGITIVLDQPDFAPGERVRGAVVVDWPADAAVRGIHVTIEGAESVHVSVSTGSGKHRRTVTHRRENSIVSDGFVLFGREPVGFFRALREGIRSLAGRHSFPILRKGRHQFAFDFLLPAGALPTHHGPHADVAYEIAADVDVPLGFDLVTRGELRVLPPRGTGIAAAEGASRFGSSGMLSGFDARGRIEARLSAAPLLPGAALEGRIHVVNESRKKIRRARFSLKCIENAEAAGHVRVSDTEVFAGDLRVPDPAAREFDAVFGFQLPPAAVAYAGRHSATSLALDVTLDVAWSFDVSLRVPLETERLRRVRGT
jgi:hypothetical protein